eukprot:COSAG02_NODE_39556_length_415_cov_2.987342_1_plen_33_part_10
MGSTWVRKPPRTTALDGLSGISTALRVGHVSEA